jgi:hypothetical protein
MNTERLRKKRQHMDRKKKRHRKGIEGVLVRFLTVLLVDAWRRALTFDPVVTRGLQVPITHGPHFLADRLEEVTVVRNDEHTTQSTLNPLNASISAVGDSWSR